MKPLGFNDTEVFGWQIKGLVTVVVHIAAFFPLSFFSTMFRSTAFQE
jgi:hypothetical protein